DYLVVDLPPGTGDVALSLSQTVPVAGAIVVTTPQQVSLADTRRAIGMYRKLNIPPLGIVENMSYFVCPDCGHEADIFGRGAGAPMPASIIDPYLKLQTALAQDRVDDVRASAGEIATASTALGAPAMKIDTAAVQLAAATELADAREKFGTLTDAMVTYMDGMHLNAPDGVRKAYCPMA